MAKLRVRSFSISLDGYGAGPDQDLANPLGVGGQALHQWFFGTRTFQQMHGGEGGVAGIDDEFAARGFAGVGAWILGRNMFGPVRGPWVDESWKGWWGDNPPYHVPVFVLTQYPRASITMEGGTVFHFVTDGIEAALARAMEAAGGLDVRLGGGWRRFDSICALGLSMRCIWRYRLCCWALGRIYLVGSMRRSLGIGVRNMLRVRRLCTLF